MSPGGTGSHSGAEVPELVARALELARGRDFGASCRIEQGRLLRVLAGGAATAIGETGTGCGVGLAWLVSGRRPGVRVVSVERDAERAAAVRELFAEVPDVEIVTGDWTRIHEHGVFDLLVLDGGGNGKRGPAAEPGRLLVPGGVVVIDDYTPMAAWPPRHDGELDSQRLGWLEHPELLAAEVRLAPDLAAVVGTFKG